MLARPEGNEQQAVIKQPKKRAEDREGAFKNEK